MTVMRTKTVLLLCAVVAQLVNGCQTPSNAGKRGWPGVASDVRVQWTAESGIGVTEGVAVPVRAYLESYDLVEFTGNFDNAYPGFLDAVPPNEATDASDRTSTWDRRPTDKYPAGWDLVGNLRFHIQSVEHTDSGATVTLCEYRYALGQRKPDGSYVPYITNGWAVDRGIFGVRLDLVAPPHKSEVDLPPRRGPSLAPKLNVFDGWQIVGYLTTPSAGMADWPAKAQVVSTCVENAPDSRERRQDLASGPFTSADFASSPADPGWPE
jgi:hypothetical protein